jgi:type IV pilus assembly protein PilB
MSLFIPPQQLRAILVQENIITSDRFDELAAVAERKGQNLIDILVSERVADAQYLSSLIANTFGVELANLGARQLDESILKVLPEQIARQRQVIIFGREADGTYQAAMADPGNLETIEFLQQRLKGRVRPYLAIGDDLNRGFSVYGFRSTEEFKRIIETNIQESLVSQAKSSEEAAADLPIVAIVDNVLSYALALRASDIHIEALEDSLLIRYRVDGILMEIARIPKAVHGAIVARMKILSGLKLDEHYKPQDGRFRYQVVNDTVDVRVSVMPTYYGEKVEMRLLESSQKPLSLTELGILDMDAKIVGEAIKKTFGMIIVCGPTGSGKTTTLYALMNILNRPEVNICSVEDPIEYNMRYVNQSQINPQAGITFATGLRALLRQDPNIIMVGEIRDKETAGISVQAALTGHLLLSSLHTNDAPTAIPRLFDLDIPPFLVSSTLNLVVAQRLVRRICSSCITSFKAGADVEDTIRQQFHAIGVDASAGKIPTVFYRGTGCNACGGTGYHGRLGIFEIIAVNDAVRRVIVEPQFDLDALRRAAREAGMQMMFEDGIAKVQLGITTIEEVLRVIKE